MTQTQEIRSKKLWNRLLSCGHNRFTNLAYIAGNYKKPEVGDICFCRQCNENAEIIKVEEENNTAIKMSLENVQKELDTDE